MLITEYRSVPMGKSEAEVQQLIRFEAGHLGMLLHRNNVGALLDKSGRLVRYGLCNETKEQNKKFKSSDLIGITKTLITPEYLGREIGIYTSLEVKAEDWAFSGSEREIAQQNWHDLVIAWGGISKFVTGVKDL